MGRARSPLHWLGAIGKAPPWPLCTHSLPRYSIMMAPVAAARRPVMVAARFGCCTPAGDADGLPAIAPCMVTVVVGSGSGAMAVCLDG